MQYINNYGTLQDLILLFKFPWARQINSSRFMQICACVVNKVRQPSYKCCVLRNYSTRWQTL